MLIDEFIKTHYHAQRFKDYKPQKVSYGLIQKWLGQHKPHKKLLLDLLSKIKFFSKDEMLKSLLATNKLLLNSLKEQDVPNSRIIYITLDDAGSSSQVILNMLKEEGRLENEGYQFFDAHNVIELDKKINENLRSQNGTALIYVDDFAGSGKQFDTSRKFLAKHVPTIDQLSEFFLVHSICDEAFRLIEGSGVTVKYCHFHDINDRPLHNSSTSLSPKEKKTLTELCKSIDSKSALGYEDLAAMVVFYRNAPNNIPIVFRGNKNQNPKIGIFPRLTDLPVQE